MIKVVVPVSGGKDSQACLKLALNYFPPSEVLGMFCDTKFEHPLTYRHIERMEGLYGVKIQKISDGRSVPDIVLSRGRFPSFQARSCTDQLKIQVGKKFYFELAKAQGVGFEVWYGMRTGESTARRKRYHERTSTETYLPHEFMSKYPKGLGKLGVRFQVPILDWTTKEVFSFLGSEVNPLYALGFDRVGCFPCLAGGDKAKDKAFEFDSFGQAQKEKVIWLEKATGKSVYNRDNRGSGCAICEI